MSDCVANALPPRPANLGHSTRDCFPSIQTLMFSVLSDQLGYMYRKPNISEPQLAELRRLCWQQRHHQNLDLSLRRKEQRWSQTTNNSREWLSASWNSVFRDTSSRDPNTIAINSKRGIASPLGDASQHFAVTSVTTVRDWHLTRK